MRRGLIVRGVYRLHRWFGSALALLLMVWFASGAVMTFARYPEFGERERLAGAQPLGDLGSIALTPALIDWLRADGLARGERARLAVIEGRATWLWSAADGRRMAEHAGAAKPPEPGLADAPVPVGPFDMERARHLAERTFGARARALETITRADQWTVGRSDPGQYPLHRIALDDAEHTELYVSERSGEIAQASTRSERILCWMGAIPHWIYPAILRRERELWRDSVLWLSAAGLLVSLTGLIAGAHAWLARRRRDRAERRGLARGVRTAVRNPYLCWHERLGLIFGVFVSTWLLSGALSLNPFRWNGGGPNAQQIDALHGATSDPSRWPVRAALEACAQQLEIREAELASSGGGALLICADATGTTRVVELDDSSQPRAALSQARLATIGRRLAGAAAFELQVIDRPDDYYYPTHSDPGFRLPFARIRLSDPAETAIYLDPARGELLRHFTSRTRLERWVYNGLHSLDLPILYEHRTLWRSVVLIAMATGFTLSTLGLWLTLRRYWLQATHARTARKRESQPAGAQPSETSD